jgi:hypothetical protein
VVFDKVTSHISSVHISCVDYNQVAVLEKSHLRRTLPYIFEINAYCPWITTPSAFPRVFKLPTT